METFSRIVNMKNTFDHGEERSILVFCKEEELVKDALDGGAALAGGSDIIKMIIVILLITDLYSLLSIYHWFIFSVLIFRAGIYLYIIMIQYLPIQIFYQKF